jgi:hypothetical protein
VAKSSIARAARKQAARDRLACDRLRTQGAGWIAVKWNVAREMLGDVSDYKMRELRDTGEIDAFPEGGQWKVLVSSIYDYLCRCIDAGEDKPLKTLRRSTSFKAAKRVPSPTQQHALDEENARRKEAKLTREAEASTNLISRDPA